MDRYARDDVMAVASLVQLSNPSLSSNTLEVEEPPSGATTEDAAWEKKERKRESDRRAARKRRENRHLDKYCAGCRLPYDQTTLLRYVDDEIKFLGRTKVPIVWQEGYRRSDVGKMSEYGKPSEVMQEAVVVMPLPGGAGGAAETFGPRRVLDYNRVKLAPGVLCYMKMSFQAEGCPCRRITGMIPGPAGTKYCLVEFENKETWWASEHEIIPAREGKRERREVNRLDLSAESTFDINNTGEDRKKYHTLQGPKEEGMLSKAIAEAETFMKAQESPCIEAAAAGALSCRRNADLAPSILALTRANMLFKLLWGGYENENIKARWTITSEMQCGMKIPELADAFTAENPDETRTAIIHTLRTTDKLAEKSWHEVLFDEPAPGAGDKEAKRGEDDPSQKKKAARPTCCFENCTTPAHTTSGKLQLCALHYKDRKKCAKCHTRDRRRKGGLCEQCYEPPDSKDGLYCQYCLDFGHKRQPRKVGGMCQHCIAEGRKRDRKCIECKQSQRKHRGKLCHKCYHSKSQTKN